MTRAMTSLPSPLTAVFALVVVFTGVGFSDDVMAAQLKPVTIQAWDRYYAWADAKVTRELSESNRFLIEDFLTPDEKNTVRRQMEAGAIVVRRMHGVIPAGVHFEVPDGEIHHWWGAILIPNTTLPLLLPFLQDYGNHAGRFADVERSQLLSRSGNHFRFLFRLKRSKAIVTAYYSTEQECDYFFHGSGKVSSRSTATRIAEIEDAGTPNERERPPGDDRGFLWRLVSWWRFEQTDKGVIVECESASLSRDIPLVAKLIPGVSAYIRSVPKESLESVLTSIRAYAPKP